MKFMKLGSRPDNFYTAGGVRSITSEVSSDLIVEVNGCRYLLHKFPLFSKCLKLQRLFAESIEASQHQIIHLPEFPGGLEAFELCAKFCYGITITISGYNIVTARCAAEHLQMTEDVEKGNLVYKLDVFFSSCILNGWRDSIVTLQTTKAFPLWSEDLRITSRCIEAIASKISANPTKAYLPHNHSRGGRDDVSCNGRTDSQVRPNKMASKGWWAEDIAELSIDLYWRTMIAIKSNQKVPVNLIGDALRVYASKWLLVLPKNRKFVGEQGESDSDSDSSNEGSSSKYRLLLESIISLLPADKGAASCGFLLKLLKAANILNASSSSKTELARRVGLQLDEATVGDLLIPPVSDKTSLKYDVDIVIAILEQFMSQVQSPPISPQRTKHGTDRSRRRRSRSAENINFEFQQSRRSSSATHSSKLKVTKLVDGYLQQIARDVNLPLSKFIALAETIPEFSRLDHCDLYKAIDIYLKAHPDLGKTERKRLCRILDCKKLSVEACMHAARNEMLPLRVLIQVLFFEQARAATGGFGLTDLPNNIKALLAAHNIDLSRQKFGPLSTTTSTVAPEDQWSISGLKNSTKSKLPANLRSKLAEEDGLDVNLMNQDGNGRTPSGFKAFNSIRERPRNMFCKLLAINKNSGDKKDRN